MALTLRPARESDYSHYRQLFAELGLLADPLDEAMWLSDLQPCSFFLQRDTDVVGMAHVEVFGQLGFVRQVVVKADERGKGLGKFLMRSLAKGLESSGCCEWCLNVFQYNAAAIALYKSVGFQIRHSGASLLLPWDSLPAPDTCVASQFRCAVLEAEDDALVEEKFGLPCGQLRRNRSLATASVWKIEETEISKADNHAHQNGYAAPNGASVKQDIVGFACYRKDFGGFRPCKFGGHDACMAFLNWFKSKNHCTGKLTVLVENDATMEDKLRSLGGELQYTVYHMRGNLDWAHG